MKTVNFMAVNNLFTQTPRDYNWCDSTIVSVLRNCVLRVFMACGLKLVTSTSVGGVFAGVGLLWELPWFRLGLFLNATTF